MTTNEKTESTEAPNEDLSGLMVISASADTIQRWDDDKKKEFVGLFKARSKAARYILAQTAFVVWSKAKERQFVSAKHEAIVLKRTGLGSMNVKMGLYSDTERDYGDLKVGGRQLSEFEPIIDARAKTILDSLPPLKQAVKIIDVETADKIEKRDALKKKGEKLREQLDELSEPVVLADLDQNMTIGQLRAMTKKQQEERDRLLREMHEIGTEGSALEIAIAKALYKGLPGLSEAVMDVVVEALEQSVAMSAASRRVEETVLYGDSAAAVGMLKGFEQDEQKVSENVAAKFAGALEKLKLAAAPMTKKATKAAAKLGSGK